MPFNELSRAWFITVDTQRNLPPQSLCVHHTALLDNLPGNPASRPVEHRETLRNFLPRREPVDSFLVALLDDRRDVGHVLAVEKSAGEKREVNEPGKQPKECLFCGQDKNSVPKHFFVPHWPLHPSPKKRSGPDLAIRAAPVPIQILARSRGFRRVRRSGMHISCRPHRSARPHTSARTAPRGRPSSARTGSPCRRPSSAPCGRRRPSWCSAPAW